MEDIDCENDYINKTPTRDSELITSESGDELISLHEQSWEVQNKMCNFISTSLREQHLQRASWLVGSTLNPVESRARTGFCGRLCFGLRIQQPSLVDANE